jgi:hypothetical protein
LELKLYSTLPLSSYLFPGLALPCLALLLPRLPALPELALLLSFTGFSFPLLASFLFFYLLLLLPSPPPHLLPLFFFFLRFLSLSHLSSSSPSSSRPTRSFSSSSLYSQSLPGAKREEGKNPKKQQPPASLETLILLRLYPPTNHSLHSRIVFVPELSYYYVDPGPSNLINQITPPGARPAASSTRERTAGSCAKDQRKHQHQPNSDQGPDQDPDQGSKVIDTCSHSTHGTFWLGAFRPACRREASSKAGFLKFDIRRRLDAHPSTYYTTPHYRTAAVGLDWRPPRRIIEPCLCLCGCSLWHPFLCLDAFPGQPSILLERRLQRQSQTCKTTLPTAPGKPSLQR